MKLSSIRNYILEDIQDTWDQYLEKKIQKEYPDKSREWFDNFLKGLLRAEKFIVDMGDNSNKILNMYIKKNLKKLVDVPAGHVHDRISSDLNKVASGRLSPEKKREININKAAGIIRHKLGYNEDDSIKLATEVVDSKMDVYDVVEELMTDHFAEPDNHREFLESSGIYKLFKITKWVTDGTEEKHIDKSAKRPVHVDMEKTGWCVRFKDYFYNDRYNGGPFYVIKKLNRPIILYFNGNEHEAQYYDTSESIKLNDHTFKLFRHYDGFMDHIKDNPDYIDTALDLGVMPKVLDTTIFRHAFKNKELLDKIIRLGHKPDPHAYPLIDDPVIFKSLYKTGVEPEFHTLSPNWVKNLEIFKTVINFGYEINNNSDDNTLDIIALHGDLETAKYAYEELHAMPSTRAIESLVQNKRLSLDEEVAFLKWLLKIGVEPTQTALLFSVHNPSLMNIILDTGIRPNDTVLDYCVRNANLDFRILELLWGIKARNPAPSIIDSAIDSGDIKRVNFLIRKGFKPDRPEQVIRAAKQDNSRILRIVLYFVDNIDSLQAHEALRNAIMNNVFDNVKVLLDDLSASYTAALNDAFHNCTYIDGKYDTRIIKLLIKRGFKPSEKHKTSDDRLLNRAASIGDLSLIKFILNNGGQITNHTLESAVCSGNPKVVLFFIKRGLKPTNETLKYAIETEESEVIKLLLRISDKYDINPTDEQLEECKSIVAMGRGYRLD